MQKLPSKTIYSEGTFVCHADISPTYAQDTARSQMDPKEQASVAVIEQAEDRDGVFCCALLLCTEYGDVVDESTHGSIEKAKSFASGFFINEDTVWHRI